MNRNAANALLKILEEPPRRALLLLLSHNPGRMLPTIRSRCRRLMLEPLPDATVRALVARYRPDLAAEEGAALSLLANGSIGRALELADAGGLELYRKLLALLDGLPRLDVPALHALADRVGRADAEDAFRTVAELLPDWIARMVAEAAGEARAGEVVPGERAVMRRLVERRGLDQWVEVWEKISRLFALAESVNLDRKQVVLNAFFALEGAAR
jgi:DNA polymerase-3 subunit delta'